MVAARYEAFLVRKATYKVLEIEGFKMVVADMPAEYDSGELLEPARVERHRSVTPAVKAFETRLAALAAA